MERCSHFPWLSWPNSREYPDLTARSNPFLCVAGNPLIFHNFQTTLRALAGDIRFYDILRIKVRGDWLNVAPNPVLFLPFITFPRKSRAQQPSDSPLTTVFAIPYPSGGVSFVHPLASFVPPLALLVRPLVSLVHPPSSFVHSRGHHMSVRHTASHVHPGIHYE